MLPWYCFLTTSLVRRIPILANSPCVLIAGTRFPLWLKVRETFSRRRLERGKVAPVSGAFNTDINIWGGHEFINALSVMFVHILEFTFVCPIASDKAESRASSFSVQEWKLLKHIFLRITEEFNSKLHTSGYRCTLAAARNRQFAKPVWFTNHIFIF